MGDADLRAAVRAGLVLWAVEGLGGVELESPFLRYDPDLDRRERGKLVIAALRDLPAPAPKKNRSRLP